jgi:hypothetical protein
MQFFSPLFARGRGTVRFLEALFRGDPLAWSILGVIALGCIGYWIYNACKSKPIESSKNPYEVANTPVSESFCPRCGMRVMPLADGTCPSCREHKFAAKN